MTTRDKPPAPIVRLSGGQLSPASAWDSELFSAYPNGAEFDLVHRSRRSPPHSRMYWSQLGQIVKATEAFPTAEHMHRWLKMRLGYTEPICDPSGKVIAVTVDSTAFSAMTQAEFAVFYDKAVAVIAADMEIDVGVM